MVGPNRNILPRPELVEVAGTAIMGAFNATEKLGTLLGVRRDEGLLHTEIVYTVVTALTTPTEKYYQMKKFLIQKMRKLLCRRF